MSRARATAIGFLAVLMWASLALATVSTGAVAVSIPRALGGRRAGFAAAGGGRAGRRPIR